MWLVLIAGKSKSWGLHLKKYYILHINNEDPKNYVRAVAIKISTKKVENHDSMGKACFQEFLLPSTKVGKFLLVKTK